MPPATDSVQAAPRQVYRCERYDHKSDLWSVGVILLEMFTGQLLEAERDKAAYVMIDQLKAKMPAGKPLTDFLCALLNTVPPTAAAVYR